LRSARTFRCPSRKRQALCVRVCVVSLSDISRRWHAWQFFVALLPGAFAWWILSATRRTMEAQSQVLLDAQLRTQEELMEAAAVADAEKRSLAREVSELRRTVDELRTLQHEQQRKD
jgi:hypothetical protein